MRKKLQTNHTAALPAWVTDVPQTIVFARSADARGDMLRAAWAYDGAFKSNAEIQGFLGEGLAEQVIAVYGLMRCMPSDKTDIDSVGPKVLTVLADRIIPNPTAMSNLLRQAEQMSSPEVEDAFSGRHIATLRQSNFELFMDPHTRLNIVDK